MSHHILHIFQHGCVLGRDRGSIVCKVDGQPSRSLPFEDVRAVIIAARGVTITSNFLSALLENDAIILHCDERYQPCGVTAPLSRVVDLQVFEHQIQIVILTCLFSADNCRPMCVVIVERSSPSGGGISGMT